MLICFCRAEKKKNKFHGQQGTGDITNCSTTSPGSSHSLASGRDTPVGLPLEDLCDLVDKFEVPKVRLSKRALIKTLLRSDAAPWVGMIAPMVMLIATLLGYTTFGLILLALALISPPCFICIWEYHLQEVENRAKSLAREALAEAVNGDHVPRPSAILQSYERSVSRKDTTSSHQLTDTEDNVAHRSSKSRKRETTKPKTATSTVEKPSASDSDPAQLDDTSLITALKYRIERDHIMIVRKLWTEIEKRSPRNGSKTTENRIFKKCKICIFFLQISSISFIF